MNMTLLLPADAASPAPTPRQTSFVHRCPRRRLSTSCLPLALLLLCGPQVMADQYGDFGYTTVGDSLTITNYTGTNATLAIPDTIGGLPVTAIGDWAFAQSYALATLTIPNTVTAIGNHAFDSCTSLATVTIGTN